MLVTSYCKDSTAVLVSSKVLDRSGTYNPESGIRVRAFPSCSETCISCVILLSLSETSSTLLDNSSRLTSTVFDM
jgi:hypothetical protein